MNDLHKNNLDYLAAKHAQTVVKAATDAKVNPTDLENTLTKTLGVLQENGVYACFLYLLANKKKGKQSDESKDENKNSKQVALDLIIQSMIDLLSKEQLGFPKQGSDDVLKYIAEKITADLPTLLLAKEALEQMLIYARYGAKAADKGAKKGGAG